MSDASEWVVHPHDPIDKIADNLWRVRGVVPGAPFDRVMTVAALESGDLVIHSAVALDEPSMRELESLGRPRWLIVPNRFHRMDAARFKARYPHLHTLCPVGAKRAVSAIVAVDGGLDALPKDRSVRAFHVDGTRDREGALEVKSGSGTTLVTNDLIFNMPHRTGFGGFVMKHITASSGGPRITRIARLALVGDKPRVRAAIETMAATPDLVRVIVSHHEPIVGDVPAALRAVAATL